MENLSEVQRNIVMLKMEGLSNKEVYDVFLNNLKSLKKEFDVPTSDTAIVRRVCEVILYDHPEIFWFSGACNQMIYKNHIV